MNAIIRRISLLVVGVGLSAVVACVSTEETTSPRKLPGAPSAVVPKLNAATFAAHGELLERRGEYERAVIQYNEALAIDPALVDTRNRLGVTLNKLGQHAEATSEFRRALLDAPYAAYLHNNLGFSLYLEQKYEEATVAIQRALELNPELRRAHMNLGLVLGRQGHYEAALAAFEAAGGEADAYYNLAVVQAQAGDYALAAASLDEALDANPDLDQARVQLRQIARLAKKEEDAIAAAEASAAQRMAAADVERVHIAQEKAAQEEAQRLAAEQAREAEAVASTDDPTPEQRAALQKMRAAEMAKLQQPRVVVRLPDGIEPSPAQVPGGSSAAEPRTGSSKQLDREGLSEQELLSRIAERNSLMIRTENESEADPVADVTFIGDDVVPAGGGQGITNDEEAAQIWYRAMAVIEYFEQLRAQEAAVLYPPLPPEVAATTDAYYDIEREMNRLIEVLNEDPLSAEACVSEMEYLIGTRP